MSDEENMSSTYNLLLSVTLSHSPKYKRWFNSQCNTAGATTALHEASSAFFVQKQMHLLEMCVQLEACMN